ncbi:MAG: fibronectin type III-like domain-contianing protein [Vicinamibacteria bacterium]
MDQGRAWYGGQEAGHAIADLLFGVATPSGKLPVTFPARIEDSTAYGHYPGSNLHVNYAEGIYVGYRGFDKGKTEPLFPFGFGLSFTTFEYSNLKTSKASMKRGDKLEVSLQVRNTGTRDADEVVQLYLRDVKSSLDRPEKELKGFRRVALKAGQATTVSFTIDEPALSFFDPTAKKWVSEAGDFEVQIGASSRDIRLRGPFKLVD